MSDKTKEHIFSERQHNYKQEKEEIFKKALEEYYEDTAGETTENEETNM